MGKTGWKDNLVSALNLAYSSYEKIENTLEDRNSKSDIRSIAVLVENIGSSKDLNTIINAERVILRHEAAFYGINNPQALKSLNEATKELDGASKAFNIVQDKEKYQAASDTHSVKEKDRKNGLPKDAFHVFTNSHKTRLGNRIRSIEASFEERLLLKERHNNMQIAQKEYMKLQAKALNITLPQKSYEIEK